MDYNINHLSNVEKEVEVTFSAEEVARNITESLLHLSKTVNIKGFRKGKVPLNIVRQFYGKNVKEEAENYFISTGFRDVVEKEDLRFATQPDIFEKGNIKEGTPFVFKYRVEIFPKLDIEPQEYSAEYTSLKFEDKMVEEEMKAIASRFIEYKEDDQAASEEKDKVTVSFKGTLDGESVEGTEGKDVAVVIGERKFLPDFEKAVTGKKQGEKFDAPVNFPEDYNAKDLAGKTVMFSFEVNKVEKFQNGPEITDEFLKDKDGYPDTVEELKSELEKHISQYIENINRENKKQIACDTYIKNHEFDVPPSILKKEVDARMEEYKKKNNVETVPEDVVKKIGEESLWVTKKYMILSTLSEKLSIDVTERELDAVLAKEAASYGLPPEYASQIRNYYGEERLSLKKMEIKESKVLDKIVENMKFIEKKAEEKES